MNMINVTTSAAAGLLLLVALSEGRTLRERALAVSGVMLAFLCVLSRW